MRVGRAGRRVGETAAIYNIHVHSSPKKKVFNDKRKSTRAEEKKNVVNLEQKIIASDMNN